ncbi:hypothetical protein Cadr_000005190 [Camelus dromedarius]|uniref:Uncharacterized protein n=1 Tax=Camelus dromedarius TaxID=9838 RepID=A0A5N4E299_CAMDR|nr:hypothetical protein Cadr_000005190 [Camelus dromedarius]
MWDQSWVTAIWQDSGQSALLTVLSGPPATLGSLSPWHHRCPGFWLQAESHPSMMLLLLVLLPVHCNLCLPSVLPSALLRLRSASTSTAWPPPGLKYYFSSLKIRSGVTAHQAPGGAHTPACTHSDRRNILGRILKRPSQIALRRPGADGDCAAHAPCEESSPSPAPAMGAPGKTQTQCRTSGDAKNRLNQTKDAAHTWPHSFLISRSVEAGTGATQPQVKECPQPPAAGRRQERILP